MMINEDDWFPNPLDSMPIATDKGEYITDEYAPCEVEYDLENPDESDEIEASKKEPDNIHELMYRLATQNQQLWIGGSENASRF
mgnify:CR=1 FL=1